MSLHAIAREVPDTVYFWVGTNIPCTLSDHADMWPEGHHECARKYFRKSGAYTDIDFYGATLYCECHVCRDNLRGTRHYFVDTVGGGALCQRCRDEKHPNIPR